MRVYTIGHSTHPIEEFISMLQSFGVEVVADIRKLPGSNMYPQFNQDALNRSLAKAGIEYVHMPGLGGRRKPLANSHNTAWRSKAFMGYADYMETEEFKTAISELEGIASRKVVAYMCSEAVWWRCHRALVSDYLKAKGWDVEHIMGVGKRSEHPYTATAKVKQGNLFYGEDG